MQLESDVQQLLEESLNFLNLAKSVVDETKTLRKEKQQYATQVSAGASNALDLLSKLRASNEAANGLKEKADQLYQNRVTCTKSSSEAPDSFNNNLPTRPRKASVVFQDLKSQRTANDTDAVANGVDEDDHDIEESESDVSVESDDDEPGIPGNPSELPSTIEWTGAEFLLTAPSETMLQFRTVKKVGNGFSSPSGSKPSEQFYRIEGKLIKSKTSGSIPKLSRRVARWFVVTEDRIYYQKSATSKKIRGMFSLEQAQVRTGKSKASPTGHVLELFFPTVEGPKRIMRLFPETGDDTMQWGQVIANNVKLYTAQKVVELRQRRLKRHSQIGTDLAEEAAKPAKSYYDILNVSPSASLKVIKKAYYKLAHDFHPDKNPDVDPNIFTKIAMAFDILKHESTRTEYDLRERFKLALRHGILLEQLLVTNDSQKKNPRFNPKVQRALFSDSKFEYLYLQHEKYGTVLREESERIELRYVQAVLAGENIDIRGVDDVALIVQLDIDMPDLTKKNPSKHRKQTKVLLELDTPQARDEFLDGMRLLRIEKSAKFAEDLKKKKTEGYR